LGVIVEFPLKEKHVKHFLIYLNNQKKRITKKRKISKEMFFLEKRIRKPKKFVKHDEEALFETFEKESKSSFEKSK